MGTPLLARSRRGPMRTNKRMLQGATSLLCATIVVMVGGCDRVSAIFGDRAKAQAQKSADTAIDAYSKASEQANSAHRNVIEAFAKANSSRNLADYKKAMREQVIPRMTVFVERLELMTTGTPQLQRIHKILLAAYKKASVDMTAFVDTLQSPNDLGKFKKIRQDLQDNVEHYRVELHKYYTNHNRKLREGPMADETSSPPQSATATTQ